MFPLVRRALFRPFDCDGEDGPEAQKIDRLAAGGAVLLAAILAAYSNHFHNGFHFDDGHTIVNNAAIRELRNIPLFFRDATTFSTLPSNQSYRPLVSTLLAIDYWLAGGVKPFWFHVSNFALFLTLTLLLLFVIYYLLERVAAGSPSGWVSLAAAGWYALHPANADAVNYIIVSAEIMATLGVIASFAALLRFPEATPIFSFYRPSCDRHPGKTNSRDLPRPLCGVSSVLP